jgi:hypothetical protein
MQNMSIESERANLVHDELPYDWEGPLAQVDHQVQAEFETFFNAIVKFAMNMFINIFRMI